jgi:hypothetical protein
MEELETINISDGQFKNELKIRASISPENIVEKLFLPYYKNIQMFLLILRGYAWFGYGYCSTQNTAGRRMQIGPIKVEKTLS